MFPRYYMYSDGSFNYSITHGCVTRRERLTMLNIGYIIIINLFSSWYQIIRKRVYHIFFQKQFVAVALEFQENLNKMFSEKILDGNSCVIQYVIR